jgi:hypothetical protein
MYQSFPHPDKNDTTPKTIFYKIEEAKRYSCSGVFIKQSGKPILPLLWKQI